MSTVPTRCLASWGAHGVLLLVFALFLFVNVNASLCDVFSLTEKLFSMNCNVVECNEHLTPHSNMSHLDYSTALGTLLGMQSGLANASLMSQLQGMTPAPGAAGYDPAAAFAGQPSYAALAGLTMPYSHGAKCEQQRLNMRFCVFLIKKWAWVLLLDCCHIYLHTCVYTCVCTSGARFRWCVYEWSTLFHWHRHPRDQRRGSNSGGRA